MDGPKLYFFKNVTYFFYSNAIKIHPQFTQAKQRKHAVLCHYKLEKALEDQHKALEATLEELRQYKKQHEEWSVLLNKIMSEQASIESRLESRLQYEDFKLRQNKNNKETKAGNF